MRRCLVSTARNALPPLLRAEVFCSTASRDPAAASASYSGGNEHIAGRALRNWTPLTLSIASVAACIASSSAATAEEEPSGDIRDTDAAPPAPHAAKSGWGALLPGAFSRKRTFFKYEKRVRDFSPPEKVFQYFASVTKPSAGAASAGGGGDRLMNPNDLLRALLPVYPPEGVAWVRGGALRGERCPGVLNNHPHAAFRVFRLFDSDGDGFLTFSEYLLLATLLAVRSDSQDVVFACMDVDNSNTVSREEFQVILDHIQQLSLSSASVARTGTKHLSRLTFADGMAVMRQFFGSDFRQDLSLEAFGRFLAELKDEVDLLEFCYYDWDCNGWVDARDFARSVVASVDVRVIDRHMGRVDRLPPTLTGQSFNLEQWRAFAQLRRHASTLGTGLQFWYDARRRLLPEDFRLIVLKTVGVELPQGMVDIIFAVLGDGRGNLDHRTFIQALSAHGPKSLTM